MKNQDQSPARQKQHLLFIIAAALAAGGVDPSSDVAQLTEGDVEIPAAFPSNATLDRDGVLLTSKNYGVRIDRLSLDPELLELSGRADVLEQSERQIVELGEVVSAANALERVPVYGQIEEPRELELTLSGVQVEGRVFDMGDGARLPQEGVKITGTLPVDVTVRREKRLDLWRPGHTESVIAVDFELPPEFFDDIDWGMLG